MEFFEDGELLGEQDHHYVNPSTGKRGYRRIPAKDNSTKTWKRFALLPNIEGQKYTIGNTFTSREEQGELIFWFDVGDEYNHAKIYFPISLCEISIVKNEYWITPLMYNRIYINDVKIEMPARMHFGDYISFGEERKYWANKVLDEEPSPITLLFKKREFPPEIVSSSLPEESLELSQWDKDTATSLGQNYLLVSLILSYIPMKKLAQLRLVSKVWNEEAVKLVKRKCQVNFNYAEGGWGFDESNNSTKLLQYSVDMRDSLLHNWKLVLPTSRQRYYDKGLDYSGANPGAKLLADLEWFLLPRNLGHSIRKLELGGNILSAWELNVRTKILENLSPTLQDLVLSGHWEYCLNPPEDITFPNVNFKKLERFKFTVQVCMELPRRGRSWLESLIHSLQGVGSLHFGRWEDFTVMFLENVNAFPNLEEVTFNQTTPRVISLLLGLVKPLKKIVFFRIERLDLDEMAEFEKLLQFHSNSLESLTFNVALLPCYRFNFKINEVDSSIVLPVMPKLKHLTVGLPQRISEYYLGKVVKLTFLESRNHLHYSQQFPILQSLTLRDMSGNRGSSLPVSELIWFWKENERFYDMFFPSEITQICETLRYLDIPFEDESPCLFPRAAQVAGMFPNVYNPWINEARKMNGSTE